MGNTRWLRYSLGSLTLIGAGLGAFLVACGDDDNGTGIRTTDGGQQDGGDGTDATTDQQTAPPVDAGKPARLQLVNAATDFGPNDKSGGLRVCFAAGTTADKVVVTGLPALPDQSPSPSVPPAVYIGLGGNVTGTGLPLKDLFIQPILMNAESLFAKGIVKPGAGQPGETCDKLLAATFDGGAGPLVEGKDFWKLPVIPSGTLLQDKSYMLVLTGCTSDTEVAVTAKCGAGFDAGGGGAGIGNLKVNIYELDRATTIDPAKLGAQFIHASPAGDVVFTKGAGVGFVPAIVKEPGDAGGANQLAQGAVGVGEKTALVQLSNVNVASDYFTANATVNPVVAPIYVPLPLVKQLSFPTGVPEGGEYRNGAAFTFIAVGDPAEDADAGGRFNTKKFHYLAFPNDPPVSVYKP